MGNERVFPHSWRSSRLRGESLASDRSRGKILHVRAASLSGNERMIKHPGRRPAYPFTRRPSAPMLVRKESKAAVRRAD